MVIKLAVILAPGKPVIDARAFPPWVSNVTVTSVNGAALDGVEDGLGLGVLVSVEVAVVDVEVLVVEVVDVEIEVGVLDKLKLDEGPGDN